MKGHVSWPVLRRDLVAILRGVRPEEAEAIVDVLTEAEFEAVEVPLNSPQPFQSIERLARRFGATCLVGAGTVLSADDCARVANAGGRLMVSPNTDPDVIAEARKREMITLPGVLTATEALLALRCGASALKFFPAAALGVRGISAIQAILPENTTVVAVGGVSEADFASYAHIGVRAFGLGSSLYRAGDDARTVGARAMVAIKTYDGVFG